MSHPQNHPLNHPLSLGFSPCPNDTFVFYALVHGKINLHPFCSPSGVNFFLADVEELNRRAASGEPDICKVSARAAAHLLDHYVVLRTGGAMGYGCGPVLVARKTLQAEELRKAVIAVPGAQTTAAFLLGLNGLHQGAVREKRYDQIMKAVASGEVDAGLLIHEERFTYEEHGLRKVLDLGEWWETAHGLPLHLPLPLGVVVMKRTLGMDAILATEQAIRASLDIARREPESAMPFIRKHAQNMEPEILRLHIETFVNDFTRELGPVGENALRELFAMVQETENRTTGCESIFPGE